MALAKKNIGTTTDINKDFPAPPNLFAREPERQKLFEDWLENHNRSMTLKLEALAKALDKKADKG